LAWLIFRLPEPVRGGRAPLVDATAPPPPAQDDDQSKQETDAQRLARERGVTPHAELVLAEDPGRLGFLSATRYILRIRTNVILILASAGGYFFLSGVQTFGVEFVTRQYSINQALGTLVLLVVGVGGVVGVLAGGAIGDLLLRRGVFAGRILVSAVAASAAVVLFIPAIFTHHATQALPYIVFAGLALSAQNPPLDAARLDIMVPLLWGRAEGVRTFLRTLAQALAPVTFGGVSDYVFGGGRLGLQWTFLLMLIPLGASAYFLFRASQTYPRDVATAAAAAKQ
jgi:MFS family permease